MNIHTERKTMVTQGGTGNENIETAIDSRVGLSIRNQSFGSLGRYRRDYSPKGMAM
jgi:hypothetical protein